MRDSASTTDLWSSAAGSIHGPAGLFVVIPSPRSLARGPRGRYNRAAMPSATEGNASTPAEGLHLAALSAAALTLILGLVARRAVWVHMGVSLIILLPPLRLATAIIKEARAHRYGVAAMGILVLAFLLFSRRIS